MGTTTPIFNKMSITYEKQKEKIADIKVIGIKSGKEFN
jgi:hypothetical protein